MCLRACSICKAVATSDNCCSKCLHSRGKSLRATSVTTEHHPGTARGTGSQQGQTQGAPPQGAPEDSNLTNTKCSSFYRCFSVWRLSEEHCFFIILHQVCISQNIQGHWLPVSLKLQAGLAEQRTYSANVLHVPSQSPSLIKTICMALLAGAFHLMGLCTRSLLHELWFPRNHCRPASYKNTHLVEICREVTYVLSKGFSSVTNWFFFWGGDIYYSIHWGFSTKWMSQLCLKADKLHTELYTSKLPNA